MPQDHEVVERIIRSRHTSKVMLSPEDLSGVPVTWTDEDEQALRAMIDVAGQAPFHRRAHEQTHRQGALDSMVPWRFHVLDQSNCRRLLDHLRQRAESDPDPVWRRAWQSKIKNMLAVCGALVQVTWLPDPQRSTDGTAESPVAFAAEQAAAQAMDGPAKDAPTESPPPRMTENNIEHVAAAGAAVQNLLLASEARGWRSYWSSGGILRDLRVFDLLLIPRQEALLGAVFLTPHVPENATVITGGLRDQRGDMQRWARWVRLD